MANIVAKVRFVRCPKCHNLLPEFADVPMYQCGGCGVVLRAKNCNISKQSAVLGSPETISSQSISDNEFSNCSLKLEEQHNAFQKNSSTSSIAESHCHEKGESSCAAEKRKSSATVLSGTDEREYNSINPLAFSSKDETGSTHAKSEYSFSEEEDKFLNLGEQDSDILRSSYKLEASPESLGHSVASEEEMQSNSLNSPAASDDGLRYHDHNKYRLMSQRTFRNQWGSDSVSGCTHAKSEYCFSEEEEKSLNLSEQGKLEASPESLCHSVASEEEMQSNSLNSPAASDDGLRDQDHKYRLMSRRTFRNQWGSDSVSGCSKANETLNTDRQKCMASLGSGSFYSVQSFIESEKGGPSGSLSKCPSRFQNGSTSTKLKNLNQNRSELLKLVEELKDQLGGLYEEKKRRSQFSGAHLPPLLFNHDQRINQWPQQYQSSQMPLSYQHCHLQPDLCCKNGLCRTCSSNFCCHSSKSISSNLSSYHHKARHSKRFCRPISAGAPFVVCYKCFEMLHMPADFLISTRRLNKLKCGACSEILALTFPATANEVPQASTENDNSSEDPISFSVEYGISLAKSSSTESEPVRISSDKSQNEKGYGSPLHRLMGYPSARQLLR